MNGSRILLGVCGGIAAYKAASLCSRLVQAGAEVDVILTEDAQRFVTPLTFAALSRRTVHTSLWEHQETIPHITLVREADVFAIVPATANVIAKMALGLADDLLTNAALAAKIPLVVAPAMNSAMYDHPATSQHVRTLRSRGVAIVEPESGFLAERETGIGRLAGEPALVDAIAHALARTETLAGKRVVITAGPTREPIDPVRYLSNPSTGTMGIELAREALRRGAEVDLVLGPTFVDPPAGVRVHRVITAQEMYDATFAAAPGADIAIAAAAVSDWRPAQPSAQKIKKTDGANESMVLARTPDILAELGSRKNGTYLVGFAAETQAHEEHAREKLRRKSLDVIAVNAVEHADRGFGTGENEIILLHGDGRIPLGRGSKRELAARMWDALDGLRAAKH